MEPGKFMEVESNCLQLIIQINYLKGMIVCGFGHSRFNDVFLTASMHIIYCVPGNSNNLATMNICHGTAPH